MACEADAKGRKGFEEKNYPQRQTFQACARVCGAVDVKPIVESGLTGEAIKDALRKQRLSALTQIT